MTMMIRVLLRTKISLYNNKLNLNILEYCELKTY